MNMPGRIREIIRGFVRQVQRAFHLLVALIFLFFAFAGAALAYRLWEDYRRAPAQGLWGFGIVAGFAVALFLLGLYAFAKARNVG